MAKTLVHDPPVLILDEPTSGLDPRARIEVKALLKELRRMGKTVLISSHILSELADCCSSIGIIERGQLLMSGPIDHVYRQIRRNRVIDIRFNENADAGVSILRSCPELLDIDINGNRVSVEMDATDEQLAAILQRLTSEGVGISSFNDKETYVRRRVYDGDKGFGYVSRLGVSCSPRNDMTQGLITQSNNRWNSASVGGTQGQSKFESAVILGT